MNFGYLHFTCDTVIKIRKERKYESTETLHGLIKHTSLCLYIYIYIYAPPRGFSTLAKEFSAAARIMQSSSKEFSSLVADRE